MEIKTRKTEWKLKQLYRLNDLSSFLSKAYRIEIKTGRNGNQKQISRLNDLLYDL